MNWETWPVARIETEKRRLAVLRHLDDTPGYQLNTTILRLGAEAQGIPTTEDQALDAVAWLGEMDLVTVDDARGLVLATLTRAGQEVAQGRRIVRGIARPSPEL